MSKKPKPKPATRVVTAAEMADVRRRSKSIPGQAVVTIEFAVQIWKQHEALRRRVRELEADSTAAPEPDWVVELCQKYGGRVEWSHVRGEYVGKAFNELVPVYGYGSTPALAAKACVERLRAGGATWRLN